MIDFVNPMLASPLSKLDFQPGEWIAEEKFDGHRLIVAVGAASKNLFGERSVMAWSRNGIMRLIPLHVQTALSMLPNGVYDGELLVPGQRSYGVTELTNTDKLVYTVFDVLSIQLVGWPRNGGYSSTTLENPILTDVVDLTDKPWHERRAILDTIGTECFTLGALHISVYEMMESREQCFKKFEAVKHRHGEGLILKRRNSLYQPGKRSKDWIKVKDLCSAVLRVVGYMPGKMGPHSTLVLRDVDGNQTTVKWKNLKELKKLDKDPDSFLGRELRIEFQERTPDGSYRHPRWDRWEHEPFEGF